MRLLPRCVVGPFRADSYNALPTNTTNGTVLLWVLKVFSFFRRESLIYGCLYLCVLFLYLFGRGLCASNTCSHTRRLGWCFSTLSRPTRVRKFGEYYSCSMCFCRFNSSYWPPLGRVIPHTGTIYCVSWCAASVSCVRLGRVLEVAMARPARRSPGISSAERASLHCQHCDNVYGARSQALRSVSL